MSSTESTTSQDTASSGTGKKSSATTKATTVESSEYNDAATDATSALSGQTPSNPSTASHVESDDSTVDLEAYDNAPGLLVNGERLTYGSEVIERREEPWSGVSPRPSSSNLRGHAEGDRKEADAKSNDDEKSV